MFEFVIFFTFAAIAVIFAAIVIVHRNPVVGALALVVSFFALAVLYVLLDAPFMAALQVIVYAGAIMVLFLFVIMLLNLQHQQEERTRPVQHFLGWTAAAAFCITVIYYLVKAAVIREAPDGFAITARGVGFRMFEAYVLPFEAVSILLLAAIVGALTLSQRSARPAAAETPGGEDARLSGAPAAPPAGRAASSPPRDASPSDPASPATAERGRAPADRQPGRLRSESGSAATPETFTAEGRVGA